MSRQACGTFAEFCFIWREEAKAVLSSCQVVMMDVETFALPLMVRPGPRRSGKVKELMNLVESSTLEPC